MTGHAARVAASVARVRSAAWVAASLLGALIGCRERLTADDMHAGSTTAPALTASASTRILYPSAPGSFVDLVAGARHGVVAIRAAQPV